jgi:hypothetical protein
MRRGGYTGDRTRELKFRGSPRLYDIIRNLAEKQETTIAATLRVLIAEALERRQDVSGQQIQA